MLGASAIALAPVFVRFAEVGTTATAFYRMALAVPVLWLWMSVTDRTSRRGRDRPNRRAWSLIIVAGACFAGDILFFHAASRTTSIANATFLLNLAPVFVVLGARVLFGEPARPVFLIGLAVALLGAALLMSRSLSAPVGQLRGDAFGLAAAIFYAGYLLAVSRLRASLSTAWVMTWSCAIGALVLLPPMLAENGSVLAESLSGWSAIMALALVSQAGGQSLIAFALAHLPIGFSGAALLMQPVMAAAFGWVLFGETLGPLQAAGGLIVAWGVLIARRASRSRTSSASATLGRDGGRQ